MEEQSIDSSATSRRNWLLSMGRTSRIVTFIFNQQLNYVNIFSQLNENYTDFQININHKSKLGSSETLASMILKLADMPQAQNARWYQLHKKGHQEK